VASVRTNTQNEKPQPPAEREVAACGGGGIEVRLLGPRRGRRTPQRSGRIRAESGLTGWKERRGAREAAKAVLLAALRTGLEEPRQELFDILSLFPGQ